jgi:hypothetical protein
MELNRAPPFAITVANRQIANIAIAIAQGGTYRTLFRSDSMPLRRFACLPSLLLQLQTRPRSQQASATAALQSRGCSGSPAGPLLIRDYIQQSLYHPVSFSTPPRAPVAHLVGCGPRLPAHEPLGAAEMHIDCVWCAQTHGYFSSQSPPVGRLNDATHFNRIVGETEYKVHLQRLYKQLGVSAKLHQLDAELQRLEPLRKRPPCRRRRPAARGHRPAASAPAAPLQVAWLTPVEIFKPWYGYALAKYILEYHRHVLQETGPLTIYEVGGGTGTLATCVLVGPQAATHAAAGGLARQPSGSCESSICRRRRRR